MKRRGTQDDPFEVGEMVSIFRMNAVGEVKRVIYPGRPRGWIKYEVEFPYMGRTMTKEFSAVNLAALKGHGAAG